MNLRQNIRYGARMLRKSPGFTVTVLLTLGVAVGLTSAVYSVCDAMLWKPVALPHLETLMMVLQREPGGGADNWEALTPADLEDISRDDTAIENVASWKSGLANIVGAGGQPEGVLQASVSANFFTTIGVRPAMGRGFQPGEDESGQDREVILSDRLWRNRFGAERTIIGTPVRLDARNFVVIGIMPDSFDFPLATDIWIPNALPPAERTSRRSNTLLSLARLKQGHTAKQASAEIESIGVRLAKLYPDTNKSRQFEVLPAHRFLVNYQRQQYLITLLASGVLVLLIGCINVANLQFARATGRVREVAIRTALGASRRQVIAQLLTESVLLSIAGAALGLALGKWAMSLIKAGMPIEIQKY